MRKVGRKDSGDGIFDDDGNFISYSELEINSIECYYINKKAEPVIKLNNSDCRYIFNFSDGLAPVNIGGVYDKYGQLNGGMFGFINAKGDMVIKPNYIAVNLFVNGYAPVATPNNDGWGFINKSGNIIIKPQYDEVRSFSNNLALVKVGRKWGYIDISGGLVVPNNFLYATNMYAPGVAFVQENYFSTFGWIDSKGKYIWDSNMHPIKDLVDKANAEQERIIKKNEIDLKEKEDKERERIERELSAKLEKSKYTLFKSFIPETGKSIKTAV